MKNAEARKSPEITTDQPARSPEKLEIAQEQVPVAETRETVGPDGKKMKVIHMGGELVAHKGADNIVRVGDLSETSAQVGKEVSVAFEDLEDNFKSYIEGVLGTADLSAEDTDNMRTEMKGGMFGFLSGAALAENPPEALSAELRKAAEGVIEIPKEPSLAELQSKVADLRSTIGTLEQKYESTRGSAMSVTESKKKIEGQIEDAIRELKVTERGVLALKEAAHPTASKKEQAVMATEAMGMVPAHEAWAAVKDLPDVSRKTLEAYKKRIQEIPRLVAEIQAEKPVVTTTDRRSGREQELTPAEKKVQTLQTELAQLGQESLLIETGLQLHEQSQKFNRAFAEADKVLKTQVEQATADHNKQKELKGGKVMFWNTQLNNLKIGHDLILDKIEGIPVEQAAIDAEFRAAEQKLVEAEQKKAKNDKDRNFQNLLEMFGDTDTTIEEIVAEGAKIEAIKKKQEALVQKHQQLEVKLQKRLETLKNVETKLQEVTDEYIAIEGASIDFRTDAAIDPKDSTAFKNLADLHAANPEATEAYIQSALADKNIARGEKNVLEAFQNRRQETPAADTNIAIPVEEPQDAPASNFMKGKAEDSVSYRDTGEVTSAREALMAKYQKENEGGEAKEEPQATETVREPVRINYDQFPTQQIDQLSPSLEDTATEQALFAKSEWRNKTGVDQLSDAWAAYDKSIGPDASRLSLMAMGVPKGVLKKYPTPQALWKFVENPGFWANIKGDAKLTRDALTRFVEEANNTRIHNTSTESLGRQGMRQNALEKTSASGVSQGIEVGK